MGGKFEKFKNNPFVVKLKTFFRRLGLILWKNLLLRRNQYIVTFFEVIFPVLYLLYHIALPAYLFSETEKLQLPPDDKHFPIIDTDMLKQSSDKWCKSDTTVTRPVFDLATSRFIAYTPINPETDRVMKLVFADICGVGPKYMDLIGVKNEAELEDTFKGILRNNKNFYGAVVFTDELMELRQSGSNGGAISYKIRLPPSEAPTKTDRYLPMFSTDSIDFTRIGPRHSDNQEFSYMKSGFTGLQLAVDKALAKTLTAKDFTKKITMEPFPYPAFPPPSIAQIIFYAPSISCYVYSMYFVFASIARNYVGEKQTGVTELLRTTGVSSTIQWLGWYIHVLAPQLITIILFGALVFGFSALAKSDFLLFCTILLLYAAASASFGFFICSFCKKPTIAMIVTILLWVLTSQMGEIYLKVFAVVPFDWKIGMSIAPSLALCILIINVLFLEYYAIDESDSPSGAQWSNIHLRVPTAVLNDVGEIAALTGENSGVSNLEIMGILLLEVVVFTCLTFYFEAVLPSEYGVKRPWYLFTPGGCKRRRPVSVAPASAPVAGAEVTPSLTDDSGTGENAEESKSRAAGQEKEGTDDKASNVVIDQMQEPPAYLSMPPGFEPEPVGAIVGVDIQGMVKRFGRNKTAVNGVSLRMFSGDIFALLGHNGAGKTTLISMLTGFLSPTSGTAFVNGYDIGTDLEKARQSMGLCPQHNMLFDRLKVVEQLRLFGMLRGLTNAQAKQEANTLMMKMGFNVKAKTLAMKLSGGQKRKLSLGLALIGGTKVVVLDEPTSGLDPQGRREIWDLLLQLRGERTILLTTHFMEEADVLGDRIGIMAEGQLQCCGTSAFLKKTYGTGYTLKFTFKEEPIQPNGPDDKPPPPPPPSSSPSQENPTSEAQEDIMPKIRNPAFDVALSAVQKHIPGATFKSDLRVDKSNNEVFISLPSETTTTAVLAQMFTDLMGRKEKLGIQTIGLSPSSMDDVFIRVGELAEEAKYGGQPVEAWAMQAETFTKTHRPTRCRFISQFTAILMKKMIMTLCKWLSITIEVIFPFLTFVAVVHLINLAAEPRIEYKFVSSRSSSSGRSTPTSRILSFGNSAFGRSAFGRSNTHQRSSSQQLPSLDVSSLEKYDRPVTFYSDDGKILPHLSKIIGPSAVQVRSPVSKKILEAGRSDRVSYKRRHIVALEVGSSNLNAMFNLYPYHAIPLALNLATNTLLRSLEPNENHRIYVANHPFQETPNSAGPKAPSGPKEKRYMNYIFPVIMSPVAAALLSLGLLIIASTFISVPIEENLSKAKQLQTMTGISPVVYWGAAFCWDYFLYFLFISALLAYLLVFDYVLGYGVLTVDRAWLVFYFISILYGFPAITFSYLLSFGSGSTAGGFTKTFFIHLITGMIFGTLIPDPIKLEDYGPFVVVFVWILHLIGRPFPTFAVARALWHWVATATSNNNCFIAVLNGHPCGRSPMPYLAWWLEEEYEGPGTHKGKPGIGQEIFWMIFLGMVYAGLLMLIEFRIFGMILKLAKTRVDPSSFPPNINDEDVYLEAERVNMMVTGGAVGSECLAVHNLCKRFGGFTAVNQLNFGVHYGECFGLLGVNGAGKTTAFRIITGDERPTHGNVYGFGTSLERNPFKMFGNIGYCPQFDAILPKFTGKQMLKLFAGLRGVPFKMRGPEAMKWLSRMGLAESANVRCGRYSGGMKRRLSTAMAMIGDPTLILLDEPTSGVDPVARRQFWKILDKLKESGQSVILTSHSMEECEALCSRLGIMVNGQFQCFGGVQHLKSKFAQGYGLSIKLKPSLALGTDDCENALLEFNQKLTNRFQPCILKDRHQYLLVYNIQNPFITWDQAFKTMEEIKKEFANLIDDYSVTETSLEEVFLAFARVQFQETKVERPCCLKCLTCTC